MLGIACTDSPIGPVPAPDGASAAFETGVNAGATTFLNLSYATRSPTQKLDLYLPTGGGTAPYPVVLWVHGGGWRTGDKRLSAGAAQFALLGKGIALASVNYRLSGEAIFPAQIQDLKAAVRWLRANARKYNLDTAHVGAWGSSAGGHLASLLGTSTGVAALSDPSLGNPQRSDRVNAVADFFGPIAFLTLDVQNAFNGCQVRNGGFASPSSPTSLLLGAPTMTVPVLVGKANPVTYLTADDASFFIQHGTADCTVPWQQSRILRNAIVNLTGAGKVAKYQLIPGAQHAGSQFYTPQNTAQVVSFFETRL